MTRSILKTALIVGLVCISAQEARPISAQEARSEDDRVCSNASLTGSYGFLVTGTIVGVGPLAIAGNIKADGAGNTSRSETAVVNGHVNPPETIVGTYTVNPDCSGSTLDALGHRSQFVIVNHGKEILSVGTDPGSVITVLSQKQ